MEMKHIHTFESFLNESAGNEVIFSVDDDKLDNMLNSRFSSQLDYQDIKGDSFYSLPKRDFDRFIDMADSAGFDVDYENSEDSVVFVQESAITEAYKPIPATMKIAGKYNVLVDRYPTISKTISIAGFERQDDSNDSLYLMDDEDLKPIIGSFIVKNSDMPKLSKGQEINCTTSTGKDAKIKRIGDL
jgi:hypothetical protein